MRDENSFVCIAKRRQERESGQDRSVNCEDEMSEEASVFLGVAGYRTKL